MAVGLGVLTDYVPSVYSAFMSNRHRSSRTPTVYLYSRVSTDEQARSGLGLDAQAAELDAEAARRGWTAVERVVDDGWSAKSLRRPGLDRVLAEVRRGDVLAVAKLDRLSRSVADFVALLDRSRVEGWALVVLDLALDTTTPMGEFVAVTMANVAQLERRMIGARTSSALQAAKARGRRLGVGNRVLAPEVLARIVAERAAGSTLAAIAERLEADEVPTARGGARWYPSTVRAALESHRLDVEAEHARSAA